MNSKDLIIAKISESLATMLGAKGGQSAMRGTGIEASMIIWPDLPEGLSDKEAVEHLQNDLRELGIFESVTFTLHEGDDHHITIDIKGCVFSTLEKLSGHPVGEQAVCFFGFGLIEKTLSRLTGRKYRVGLVSYDPSNHSCRECGRPV